METAAVDASVNVLRMKTVTAVPAQSLDQCPDISRAISMAAAAAGGGCWRDA